ncbi:hypothetical protein W02_18790 [Nitrospira sp. KM1]|nr:hypothetical protein W02_18790 [Nitrospira sp. KM1]
MLGGNPSVEFKRAFGSSFEGEHEWSWGTMQKRLLREGIHDAVISSNIEYAK